MSLVWHILKKDARVIRGPWLAWVGLQVAALIAAHVAERYAWVDPYDNTEVAYRVACQGLAFLVWVFAYLLMPLAVHDDPVSGTSTAWVLKPVNPLQLLTAKVMGVAIFFIFTPVIVRLPWWLMHGYGLDSVARAASETILIAVILAIPSVWLASVTVDASRFYRWSLVWFGTLVIFYLVWVNRWMASPRDGVTNVPVPNLGLLIPVLLGSTINQFWSRRTRRSLLLVGAGFAAMLVIPSPAVVGGSALPDVAVVAAIDRSGVLSVTPKDSLAPEAVSGWVVDDYARDARRIPVTDVPPAQRLQSLAGAALAQKLGLTGPALAVPVAPSEAEGEITSPLFVRGRAIRVGESHVIPLREGESVLHGSVRIRVDRVVTDFTGARHLVAVTETSTSVARPFHNPQDDPFYFVRRVTEVESVPVSKVSIFPAAAVAVRKRILSISTTNPQASLNEVPLLRVTVRPIGQFETLLKRASDPGAVENPQISP
ncbi:MAG TPA: hypothetical protein VGD88_12550 [Opitutaceae bacterium]